MVALCQPHLAHKLEAERTDHGRPVNADIVDCVGTSTCYALVTGVRAVNIRSSDEKKVPRKPDQEASKSPEKKSVSIYLNAGSPKLLTIYQLLDALSLDSDFFSFKSCLTLHYTKRRCLAHTGCNIGSSLYSDGRRLFHCDDFTT